MGRKTVSGKVMLGTISKELAERRLKERGRELATAIRGALPEEYGYLLVLRDREGCAFFTDATKEQAIASLEEVLAHLRRT